jgi:t-SNARE complex subunit (syntaxin)
MIEFTGNYDAFKESIIIETPKKEKKGRTKEAKAKKVDVKQLEKQIHKIEDLLEQYDKELYKPENYTDKRKMDQLNQEINNYKVELEELYEVYYNETEE